MSQNDSLEKRKHTFNGLIRNEVNASARALQASEYRDRVGPKKIRHDDIMFASELDNILNGDFDYED